MTDSTSRAPILVGIADRPTILPRLLELAADLSEQTGAPLVVLNVVTVPDQIALATAKDQPAARAAQALVQRAIGLLADRPVTVNGLVELAHRPHEGMLAAARSHAAGTILVGYTPEGEAASADDRMMYRVARAATCDLLVAEFRGDEAAGGELLVPLAGGGGNLPLTASLVRTLTARRGAAVRFLHVAAPGSDPAAAERELAALLAAHGLEGPLEVVHSDDPIAAILERAAGVDMMIVGTDTRPSMLFGKPAEQLSAQAPCTVLLVRALRPGGAA